jgi:hypothetical protein
MICCKTFYTTISSFDCSSLMEVEKSEVWVPQYDSTGAANKISKADAKTLAAWVAKINAANGSDKYYPLPFLDNIVDERADDTAETLDSGTIIITKQGDRDFEGYFIQEPNCILSEVDAWKKAGSWGKYVIDKAGNIIGKYCSTDPDFLYPILVDHKSLQARLVKPTYTTSMKHRVAYRYAQIEKDADLRVLPVSELDFDPLTEPTFKGLVNVQAAYSAITTTGFTATLTDCYGCPIEGLVAGDFTLAEYPAGTSIVITSATESAAGVYDFVIPVQTGGTNMKLSGSKDGLNFAPVEANIIAIP